MSFVNRIIGVSDLNHNSQIFVRQAYKLIFSHLLLLMLTNTFIILFALETLSLSQLGIVLAIQYIVQALTDYPTGALGDWIGQRWVLFLSSLSFAIGFIFLSQSNTFVGIVLAFSILGFAQGQQSGAFQSWFDNNYKYYVIEDADRRVYGQVIGKYNMLTGLTTSFSFVVGGIFISLYSRSLVFFIQGLILAGFSFIFLKSMGDHPELIRNKSHNSEFTSFLFDGISVVRNNKTLRLLVLGMVISGSGFALWSGLILFPLYNEYAGSDRLTALLRSIVFISGALGAGIAGVFSYRVRNLRKWLAVTFLTMEITFFLTMFFMTKFYHPSSHLIWLSFVVVTLSFFFAFTPGYLREVLVPRFFLDVIPDRNRNAINSLIPTLVILLSIPYLALGGIILVKVGRSVMILLLALNGIIGGSICTYAILLHEPLVVTKSDTVSYFNTEPIVKFDLSQYTYLSVPGCVQIKQ
ncbi:MAG: MFS transporter [Candidatus Kariarchaeaceae archaeon]|jgi:MFS family permease